MNRLEDGVRLALRREEPSADFTDRIMARIAHVPIAPRLEKERKNNRWLKRLNRFFQPSPMKWAIAGAVACLLMFAGIGIHQYRERQRAIELAEGERAKEQVLLAMRIASSKLNVAQKKVHERSER